MTVRTAIHLPLEHLNKGTSLRSDSVDGAFVEGSSLLVYPKSSCVDALLAASFVLMSRSVNLV